MAKPRHLRLSKRVVDRPPVDGGDILFRDRELPGFGVRVYPSGRKVCVAQTRGPASFGIGLLVHHHLPLDNSAAAALRLDQVWASGG